MFSLRSRIKPEAKKTLKPKLELINRNDLSKTDKYKIRKYLERDFFYSAEKYDNFFGDSRHFDIQLKQVRIWQSIKILNDMYKKNCYAERFLKNPGLQTSCTDFYDIFTNAPEDVSYELLSIYLNLLFSQIEAHPDTFEVEYDQEQKTCLSIMKFKEYLSQFNDVFSHYGINIYFTPTGIIPKQEKMIIDEIYEPTLDCLLEDKRKEVNRDLKDAFDKYKNKDFSTCITLAITALQGFLQILVHGSIGKGQINGLITEAAKKGLIPNDQFTKETLKNIESTIMQTRQKSGDAHPKIEYANEKTAVFVMNLVMVSIQHSIRHNK